MAPESKKIHTDPAGLSMPQPLLRVDSASLQHHSGMALAEVILIAIFAFVIFRLSRIRRAVPVAASMLLTIGVVWFFVRLRA